LDNKLHTTLMRPVQKLLC